MELLELNKMTDFQHVNLFSMDYKDRVGNKKRWLFASRRDTPVAALEGRHDATDAVVVVPIHQATGHLVLIKEFRVALGGYIYGFPAGLMDQGETIEETAVRELKEETGLELTTILKSSPPVYSSSGLTDESVSLVFAQCTGEPSLDLNEDSEEIEVIMLSKAQARDLLETPDLSFDVKSWILLSVFSQGGSF